jgi:hypothetical protein
MDRDVCRSCSASIAIRTLRGTPAGMGTGPHGACFRRAGDPQGEDVIGGGCDARIAVRMRYASQAAMPHRTNGATRMEQTDVVVGNTRIALQPNGAAN